MSLISYNLGVPASNNNPSNDQPLMLQNNDAIPAYVAVDHVAFGANNSGYHRIIHQVGASLTVDPGTISGVGQLYTKNTTINSILDTQLFYKTGTGVVTQLTGFNPTANGYAYMGGMLIQWGVVNAPSTSGSVSFSAPNNINFPNNCFGVQLTSQINSLSPTDTFYSLNGTPSQTSFSYHTINGGTSALFWMAIGN